MPLIALGRPPQQNVVSSSCSAILISPDKKFCGLAAKPLARRLAEKFPPKRQRKEDALEVLLFLAVRRD